MEGGLVGQELVWIAAARAGDVQAFNQLVLRHQSMAYNLALRIMSDAEAAADVTQDAFLSAFQNIRQLRGGSFKSWLWRIVVNGCFDALRKERPVAGSVDDLEQADCSWYLIDPSERPDQFVERRELDQIIQAGIQSLPPDQRVVLVLSDVQGLTYQEIAGATGFALGTVKSRLSRGRAKLREYLLNRAGAVSLIPGEGQQAMHTYSVVTSFCLA